MEKMSSDEIDLLQLLAKIFRAFKTHLILTIAFPLLGLILGILVASSKSNTVTSEMLLDTDLLSKVEVEFLAEQLNNLGFMPILDQNGQNSVVKIEYEVLQQAIRPEQIRTFLKASATVTDEAVLPVLQDSMVSWLNRQDAFAQNRIKKERFYKDMIAQIDKELKAMDEMKASGDLNTKSNILNPADLYVEAVNLNERRVEYQIALDGIKSIRLVKGFNVKHNNSGIVPKIIYGAVGAAVGFFLVVVTLAFMYFFLYYRQYEKSLES